MKKLILVIVALIAAVNANAKGDWKGKVVDSNGDPVAYANVAVLSKADSTVVCGAVTEEDGTFNLLTTEKDGIMMVAMLGYKTVYFTPVNGIVITLLDDTTLLEGAAVQAIMPKTKITGEGLQTAVRGSVLENAGSAKDVLAKTPGIIKSGNGLEVIGKGAPLVYINGHKVTDASELERLQSNEIQSVEVISNPGAQYDATVKAVVRIKTIKRQGDGFGFNANASDAQSLRWAKGNDQSGAVNVNYRNGGVDYFGGINYTGSSNRQLSDAEAISYYNKNGKINELKNNGTIDGQGFEKMLYGNAGVNWQIADNHFMGGKIEWGRTLQSEDQTIIDCEVFENSKKIDQLSTVSADVMGSPAGYNIGGNLYYNGVLAQKLGVDVNFDYYGTESNMVAASNETSTMTSDAAINSLSGNTSRMYAAKAVLSYPLWIGQLQAGTEETFSRRKDKYSIAGIGIPSSQSTINEGNYAGFASYGFFLPGVGQISAGARFEHVTYGYEDALNHAADTSFSYSNLFPTVSYAGIVGPVQLMLNYSTKTRRPSYSNLSDAIRYNSRYIWQSGNARLRPEVSHNISLLAAWQWVNLMVNYSRTDDAMMTWSAPYVKEGIPDGVVLVKPRNIDVPYRSLQVFLNATPVIGPWTLNYTVGIMPQWLTLTMEDPRAASGKRSVSFNDKVPFVAQIQNTLTLKGGWQLELGGTMQTKGYTQNIYLTTTYLDVTAAVQKTLLKDGSLVLRLEGADLAGLAVTDIDTDFGSHTIKQTNIMDTQKVKFSIRYNFNTAKSKYRGTGAGADEKARM